MKKQKSSRKNKKKSMYGHLGKERYMKNILKNLRDEKDRL